MKTDEIILFVTLQCLLGFTAIIPERITNGPQWSFMATQGPEGLSANHGFHGCAGENASSIGVTWVSIFER